MFLKNGTVKFVNKNVWGKTSHDKVACFCLWISRTVLRVHDNWWVGMASVFQKSHCVCRTSHQRNDSCINNHHSCTKNNFASIHTLCRSFWPLSAYQSRCRGSLLHVFALWHAPHSVGLICNEGSARRRDIYLTTQNSQYTNIHTTGRIQTPQSQQAVGPRLTP